MTSNSYNSWPIRSPHHINHILTPKQAPQITEINRRGFFDFFIRIEISKHFIKGDFLVVRKDEDVCVGEEVGVMDRGAVIDGLVEGFFFVGYGGVVEIYQTVCWAG